MLFRSPSAVFVNRKIVHIKPDIYIVADACYTGGAHTYTSTFHFNNRGKVKLEKDKVLYTGEKAQVELKILGETKNKLIETRLSRNYNQAEMNTTLQVERQGEGCHTMISVISTNPIGDDKPMKVEKIPVKSVLKAIEYPDHFAEAVRIQKDGKDYVVILCHQEVNSPTDLVGAADCMGFGNVIVFDRDKEREVGTVLNW